MNTDFPDLAEVLQCHRLLGDGYCLCGWPEQPDLHDHEAHQAAMWLEHRTIRSVEMLNKLPAFALVKTKQGNAILRMYNSWWVTGGTAKPWIPDDRVSAPYLLLWHPSWEPQP